MSGSLETYAVNKSEVKQKTYKDLEYEKWLIFRKKCVCLISSTLCKIIDVQCNENMGIMNDCPLWYTIKYIGKL